MEMEDPFEAMLDRLSRDPETRFTGAEILGWAGSLANWDFYNRMGLCIAERYHAGVLSYTVCDQIVNDLWRAVLSGFEEGKRNEVPYPFYDVYEAFDAGEYCRAADRSDDPVAMYTDPMIRELLLQYSAGNIDRTPS